MPGAACRLRPQSAAPSIAIRPGARHAGHGAHGTYRQCSTSLPTAKIGILGIGAGAVTVYARAQDHWRLYEINPMAPDIARKWFTYLADSPAK